MINRIEIKNFKVIKELILEDIPLISIIGGKNNTGKSTLLEGIFLFYDRANPDLFMRQHQWRGLNALEISSYGMWAPFFYNLDLEQEIKLSFTVNEQEEKVVIKYNPSISQEIYSNFSQRIESRKAFFPLSTTPQGEAIELIYYINNHEIGRSHFILDGTDQRIKFNKKVMKPIKVIYLSGRRNPIEDAMMFGKLDMEGKVSEIVDDLRIIEPRVKSLSAIPFGNTSAIYADIGIGKKLPVSLMGEGTAKLLSMILSIASTKDGIVLIDELENGIHYSIYEDLWRLLIKLAQKYNCQLFITTHSYEIIKYLKFDREIKNNNIVKYYRLSKEEDQIVSKHYDQNTLQVALENDWEIR